MPEESFGCIIYKKKERVSKQQRTEMCTPTNKWMHFNKLESRIVPVGEQDIWMVRKIVNYVFLYKGWKIVFENQTGFIVLFGWLSHWTESVTEFYTQLPSY